MPCLLGCLALAFPRGVLFLVWAFGGSYLDRAYDSHWWWPLLGFFFLPLTTLAFAYGSHSLSAGGELSSLGWLVVLLALAADVGLIGGGGRGARRFRASASD